MGFWDEPSGSDECSMDQTELTDRNRDPWRCKACNQLMMLTDKKGNPAGAPMPKHGGIEHPELCTACFQMKSVLDSNPYWMNLHKEWLSRQRKLKPGSDYLA